MKARTNGEVNGKVHEVKGETNEKLRKPTNDPTLEGKDENKVGRIQRKSGRSEKALNNDTKSTDSGFQMENFEHSPDDARVTLVAYARSRRPESR